MAQGWIGILANLPWAKDAAGWKAGLHVDAPRFAALQTEYADKQAKLWASLFARDPSRTEAPIAAPDKGDKRFAASAWRDNPYYDYLKQSYLLSSRYLA